MNLTPTSDLLISLINLPFDQLLLKKISLATFESLVQEKIIGLSDEQGFKNRFLAAKKEKNWFFKRSFTLYDDQGVLPKLMGPESLIYLGITQSLVAGQQVWEIIISNQNNALAALSISLKYSLSCEINGEVKKVDIKKMTLLKVCNWALLNQSADYLKLILGKIDCKDFKNKILKMPYTMERKRKKSSWHIQIMKNYMMQEIRGIRQCKATEATEQNNINYKALLSAYHLELFCVDKQENPWVALAKTFKLYTLQIKWLNQMTSLWNWIRICEQNDCLMQSIDLKMPIANEKKPCISL